MPAPFRILGSTKADLDQAASLLISGEILAVPTETVYGLAGNAFNEASVRKIFEVKGRPLTDPLIVHFASLEAARIHIEPTEGLNKIASKFWPGPLTLIVRKKTSIPDIVTAGLPSVAIRISAHPIFRDVLSRLSFPLAAPSANPFGYISPTKATHVMQTLRTRISAVIDGGPCTFGIESTILDLRTPNAPKILRPGPISKNTLHAALGIPVLDKDTSLSQTLAQDAPGLLPQHYSPNCPIHLIKNGYAETQNTPTITDRTPLIFFKKPRSLAHHPHIYWLSENGDVQSAAHTLFDLLYQLDQHSPKQISIELAPEIGIGIAINDRLRRSAGVPSRK